MKRGPSILAVTVGVAVGCADPQATAPETGSARLATVAPAVSISGPTSIPGAGWYDFTAVASGMGSTPYYEWDLYHWNLGRWLRVGCPQNTPACSIQLAPNGTWGQGLWSNAIRLRAIVFDGNPYNSAPISVPSDTAELDVLAPTGDLWIDGPEFVQTGGQTTYTPRAPGLTGSPTYQWRLYDYSTNTWSTLGTAQTQSLVAAPPARDYMLEVTVTSGAVSISARRTIINPEPRRVTVVIDGPTTIGTEGSYGWTAIATGGPAPAHWFTYFYRWDRYRFDVGAWESAGPCTTTCSVYITQGVPVRLRVIAFYWTPSPTAPQDTAIIDVVPPGLSVRINGPEIASSTSGPRSYSATATGGSGSYAYQWRVLDFTTGAYWDGGTAATLTLATASSPTDYRLDVTVIAGSSTTTARLKVVDPAWRPLNVVLDGARSIVTAGTYTYEVLRSGGNGEFLTYLWQAFDANGNTRTGVEGPTTTTTWPFSLPSNEGSSIRVRAYTSCCTTPVDTAEIAVLVPPIPQISGPTAITSQGTYSWAGTVSNGPASYSWEYRNVGSSAWNPLGSSPQVSRPIYNSTSDFYLRLAATNAAGPVSATILVDVQLTCTGKGCNPNPQ